MLEDKNISYQQVREFVFPNIPKRLYRYREFDEYYMNNVSGEVYLSYPCKFNDPFDSAIEIDYLKYTKLFFQRELPKEFPIGKVEDIFKNNDVIKRMTRKSRMPMAARTYRRINRANVCISTRLRQFITDTAHRNEILRLAGIFTDFFAQVADMYV